MCHMLPCPFPGQIESMTFIQAFSILVAMETSLKKTEMEAGAEI